MEEQKPGPENETAEGQPAEPSASLESNTTSVESGDPSDSNIDATGETPADAPLQEKPEKEKNLFKRIRSGLNIYLLLMIVILFISVGIVVVTYMTSKHDSGSTNISSSQQLTQNALEQLANSDSNATIGTSSQVLTVQSSAIFSGKVLMRQDLEVAGNLDIGNTLTLNDLSVSGTAQTGQLNVNKDLSVSGNDNVQGSETVGKSLQVNGPGIFSGPITAPQLTTSSFQLNSDLVLTHHIVTGGSTPKAAFGSALGSGGTASLSGNDTAGSVNVNTGSNTSSGCFVTINFTSAFHTVPHVVASPIGIGAGTLNYYVDRTATSFSICDATAPPQYDNFGFDYIVLD